MFFITKTKYNGNLFKTWEDIRFVPTVTFCILSSYIAHTFWSQAIYEQCTVWFSIIKNIIISLLSKYTHINLVFNLNYFNWSVVTNLVFPVILITLYVFIQYVIYDWFIIILLRHLDFVLWVRLWYCYPFSLLHQKQLQHQN